MDTEATKREYDRLSGWRMRWLRLANDRERCRRRWPLQRHSEYMQERSQKANIAIGNLLRSLWAWQDSQKAANAKPKPAEACPRCGHLLADNLNSPTPPVA